MQHMLKFSLFTTLLISVNAFAAMFTPGVPCNGCDLEIFDHAGVVPTSKNAVFRVQNPQTPNGPAPFIELYNSTLATIQDCAQKVQNVRGRPGSVMMKAREYTLSGSNQVVFLVSDCRLKIGPGGRMGKRIMPSEDMTHEPESGMDSCPAFGDVPPDTSCSTGSGGWQSAGNVLSESCQLSYDDLTGSGGRQQVIYDNTYSVACAGGSYEHGIYVGPTPSDSNWGAYVPSGTNCQMKTGVRPSDGARVVEKIVCP
jgi:hypothetical protein